MCVCVCFFHIFFSMKSQVDELITCPTLSAAANVKTGGFNRQTSGRRGCVRMLIKLLMRLVRIGRSPDVVLI